MTNTMSHRKLTQPALPFWSDDKVLVGSLYLVTGLLVGVAGFLRIWGLWFQLQPYLPFSLPPDIPERIAAHFSEVLSTFVNSVASLAALLLGISWCLSGLAELLAARREGVHPGSLAEPERVAELISREPSQGAVEATEACSVASLAPVTLPRFGQVSKRIFYGLCWNVVKLLMILLVVKLLFILANYIPILIQETIQGGVLVHVPPASPLYTLIGVFIAVDIIMALSLLTTKTRPFGSGTRIIHARGAMHPHFLLSLFEESAAMVTSSWSVLQTKWRLIKKEDKSCQGSLIESVQQMRVPKARLVGYPAMALSIIATSTGFYTLMNLEFRGAFDSVGQFAAVEGLSCLVRVIFLVGLVLLGGHLARWAETFLQWTAWKSLLLLVVVWQKHDVSQEKNVGQRLAYQEHKKRPSWVLHTHHHYEQHSFAVNPRGPELYLLAVFWASAYSESSKPTSRRILVGGADMGELDEQIDAIIEAPFLAHFEKLHDRHEECREPKV